MTEQDARRRLRPLCVSCQHAVTAGYLLVPVGSPGLSGYGGGGGGPGLAVAPVSQSWPRTKRNQIPTGKQKKRAVADNGGSDRLPRSAGLLGNDASRDSQLRPPRTSLVDRLLGRTARHVGKSERATVPWRCLILSRRSVIQRAAASAILSLSAILPIYSCFQSYVPIISPCVCVK
ncbi:hypothetical protein SKAU_G00187390 [Synaphobranchus kaupii]|uniref:Uncharacterized protein n=1 Tax=Synaphobranchus kaupii TaxID=118154 RepID=A0A9Q1IX35_SYNKA|nr:hypothetical protein SKAU_G00187390 [Synaphobranchus kaupii]